MEFNTEKGTVTWEGKTYQAFIRRNGQRIAVSELQEGQKKNLLDHTVKLLESNSPKTKKVEEVSKIVLTASETTSWGLFGQSRKKAVHIQYNSEDKTNETRKVETKGKQEPSDSAREVYDFIKTTKLAKLGEEKSDPPAVPSRPDDKKGESSRIVLEASSTEKSSHDVPDQFAEQPEPIDTLVKGLKQFTQGKEIPKEPRPQESVEPDYVYKPHERAWKALYPLLTKDDVTEDEQSTFYAAISVLGTQKGFPQNEWATSKDPKVVEEMRSFVKAEFAEEFKGLQLPEQLPPSVEQTDPATELSEDEAIELLPDYPAFERNQGEQTCYANTFLQLQLQTLGDNKITKTFRGQIKTENDDLYLKRKTTWEALYPLLKAGREGKSVSAKAVKTFLSAAHELGKAFPEYRDNTWNDPSKPQDINELYAFIRFNFVRLGSALLPNSLSNTNDFGQISRLHLEYQEETSVATLTSNFGLSKQTEESVVLPEQLSLALPRVNENGFLPTKVTVDETLTINRRTYQLVGAAAYETKGQDAKGGHYVAYRKTGEDQYTCLDDAKDPKEHTFSSAQEILNTTATLLIYEQVG